MADITAFRLVLRETAGERHSPDALKPAELEPLSGTCWRLMVMPSALNQLERVA
jgi:hypothetical protein